MGHVGWSFGLAAVLGSVCAGSVGSRVVDPDAPALATGFSGDGAGIDLKAIDRGADACRDFYRHACGGFIDSVALTPERSSVSLTEAAFEANVERSLNRLFSIPAAAGSELDRLGSFYKSCLGDQRSSVALTRDWLARIDAARTPADIRTLILELQAIGVNPFFSYAGTPDPKDPTRYRGEIDHSNLWQEPAVVERAFVLAGLSPVDAKADADAVAAIVTELRKHRATGNDPAAYENPTTLAELKRMAPAIDWPRQFAAIGAKPGRAVNLTSARYLPAVSRELARRSPAELRAYLRWAFLFSLRGELPAPYNQAFGAITPPLRVALDQPARRCRDATIRGMGVEFSRQYSERILGLRAREAAYRIGASIQARIADAVEQADWLSPEARRATADKLRQTDLKLGFPDRWPTVGDFPVGRRDFLANVLAARRYEEARAWRRANEPRSREDWDMLVYPWIGIGMAAARLVTPNAFPDPNTNSMVMTAAFLNPPAFAEGATDELNYAGFGVTFAHEFVHIAETHEYGPQGEAKEQWSPADIASAKKRTACVIEQAEAAPAPQGARISGASNYSENVADLGAIRLAYEALAARLGAGLNRADATGMTPAKRFFYRYAQNYCLAASPETLRQLVADDPHALPSYRVNGPLSNLPAFGQAFGCGAGTPMRRREEKICRVW